MEPWARQQGSSSQLLGGRHDAHARIADRKEFTGRSFDDLVIEANILSQGVSHGSKEWISDKRPRQRSFLRIAGRGFGVWSDLAGSGRDLEAFEVRPPGHPDHESCNAPGSLGRG